VRGVSFREALQAAIEHATRAARRRWFDLAAGFGGAGWFDSDCANSPGDAA